jgi:3-hydroxybutyryl-CoA dehydrogenase
VSAREAVATIGLGRMARQIAHVFAYGGHPVTIIDFKPRPEAAFARLAEEARAEIAENLRVLATLGVFDSTLIPAIMRLVRIVGLAAAEAAVADARLIWECVPERLEDKQDALGRVSRLAASDAVIASTTSTMLVTELQRFVARPERFLNAHFLNPAYLIPLVEMSPGPETAEAAVERLRRMLEGVGKVPVRCKASPGYIVPRLQSLVLSEAARMVHEGVATAEDIDKAVMNGFGPRYATMGAIEFIDWGGVDILYYAGHYLAKALDSPRHAPPPELGRKMEAGHRGLREGRGYYDYRNVDVAAYQRAKLARLVGLLTHLGQVPKPGAA